MHKKFLGFISTIAAMCLVLVMFSPATVATWRDEITLPGGQITSGNLDIENNGKMLFYTTENGTSDKKDFIPDIEEYRIRPGETIMSRQFLDVGLEGNNIKALFSVDIPGLVDGNMSRLASEGMDTYYNITNINNNTILTQNHPMNGAALMEVINPDDVNGKVVNGVSDYQIDMFFAFPERPDGDYSGLLGVKAELMASRAHLNQVTDGNVDPEIIENISTEAAFTLISTDVTTNDSVFVDGLATPGEEITYTVVTRNDSEMPLVDVTMDGFTPRHGDGSPIVITPNGIRVEPGEEIIWEKKHTVTEDDHLNTFVQSAESMTGTAELSGKELSSSTFVLTLDTSPVPNPAATLDSPGYVFIIEGDDTDVSHMITNTGNVGLSEGVITIGNQSWPVGSLAPGQTLRFPTNVSLDADGQYDVIFTARPNNESVSREIARDTINAVVVEAEASLTIISNTIQTDESVYDDGKATVGEKVTFTAVVRNDGNTEMRGVSIPGFTPSAVIIPPGGQYTFTREVTVTEADATAGNITLDVNASGMSDNTTIVGTVESNTVNFTIPTGPTPAPDLSVVTASIEAVAGKPAILTHVVTNTGNVPMNNVIINANGDPVNVGTLAPGESKTVTSESVEPVTRTVDVVTTARPDNEAVSREVHRTTAVINVSPPVATLTVVSSKAVIDHSVYSDAKANPTETVTFTEVIRNDGNIAIKDISLSVAGYTPATITLDAGESATFVRTITTLESDVAIGAITYNTTATGTPEMIEAGASVSTSQITHNVPVGPTPAPGMSIVSQPAFGVEGQVISVSHLITNTGNVPVHNIVVVANSSVAVGTMAAGESRTVVTTSVELATRTTATKVRGKPDNESSVRDMAAHQSLMTIADAAPELIISGTGFTFDDTYYPDNKANPGEVATMYVDVKNNGNIPLENVSVEGFIPTTKDIAPGDTQRFTKNHTVTSAEGTAGSYTENVTATGKPNYPANAAYLSASGTVTIDTVPLPVPSATLSVSNDSIVDGETASIRHVVTNNGSTTLYDVRIESRYGTVTVGQLNAGASSTQYINGSPSSTTTINASVFGRAYYETGTSLLDSDTAQVNVTPRYTNLTITNTTASPSTVDKGSSTTIRTYIKNNSNYRVYVKAGNSYTNSKCTVGYLNPGSSGSCSLSANVGTSTGSKTVRSYAYIGTTSYDSDTVRVTVVEPTYLIYSSLTGYYWTGSNGKNCNFRNSSNWYTITPNVYGDSGNYIKAFTKSAKGARCTNVHGDTSNNGTVQSNDKYHTSYRVYRNSVSGIIQNSGYPPFSASGYRGIYGGKISNNADAANTGHSSWLSTARIYGYSTRTYTSRGYQCNYSYSGCSRPSS